MTSIQLPAEATAERTLAVVEAYEQHVASRPAIASNQAILGYSFSGSGPSAALTYTMLKDWGERGGSTASDEVKAAQQAMATVPEGEVMSVMPPAIDSLGRSSGFSLALQARTGQGQAELRAALQQLLKLAEASPLLAEVNADGLPAGSNVRLDIDRAKAEAMGVAFTDISATLSAAMGSQYVNDFPNRGRMQQVIMQADAPYRMELEDVLKLYVRNSEGGMVALSELVTPHWTEAPLQLQRYLGFPALNLSGAPAGGVSTGQAMVEMERLAQQLPAGFALQWTSQSLQERESGAQAPWLLLLSMLVVFLVLAALYESWSIPLAVMLVVPLGLLGAVAAVLLRGMPNDVFFKVGMITVIGLSAKNAILIVEFARQLQQQGRGLVEATIEAARLRLRPIVMTSLAFALGVVPLMLAQGASKETQQAIGTGVFGGMVSATVLAVFFVPVFYVVVQGAQQWLGQRLRDAGRRREGAWMENRWMESRNPEGLYEAQLRVLEQQLRDALLDGDHGAATALLSPVLFMMDGQGGRMLDLPWLRDWQQGHLQIHALQAHAVETLLCGRLALLSGDVQLHVHWRGREHVQRLRLLRVWTSASSASGAQLLSMAVLAG